MKLKTLYLSNFRCYKNYVEVNFDNLTTFIGKNDIGKSTILEALEILWMCTGETLWFCRRA